MKHKKTILILLTCLLLLCTSCSESRRFGMQELSRRVGETDERFAFSTDGISLSNGFYHIPFSVSQENDLLLSCEEDSEGQLLQILLTAEKNTAPIDFFMQFAGCLTRVFMGIDTYKADEMLHEAGLTDESVLFSDHTGTAEDGRYSVTFYSSPVSISLILRYDDAVMIE
ncbi:MAG: hypothetical protein IJO14_00795 [Clostridia bacterium]|nr:hypothetical protein [Clostridia bacterium]